MKNIHILSTDKPSRLHLGNSGLVLCDLIFNPTTINAQHIYITSNEEIKEGDWFYNTISLKPEPFKACENGDGYVNCSRYSHYRIDCKKIILTTDQDLIKDGVQAIPDDFLEWFVKNPSCEKVEIESWQTKGEWDLDYKIIIPKEEPKQIKCYCGHTTYCDCSPIDEPKQETFEEVAERLYPFNPYSIGNGIKYDEYAKERRCFIEGAKWQAERMYSEEDLLSAFEAGMMFIGEDKGSFREWFEQFKNK